MSSAIEGLELISKVRRFKTVYPISPFYALRTLGRRRQRGVKGDKNIFRRLNVQAQSRVSKVFLGWDQYVKKFHKE